ncbi:MAG: MBL fold metallo-hydrolase [Candidatus Thiodiazotropha sp.]
MAGAEDPRLGKIDLVLVSHMHGDHVGDKRIARTNAGSCEKPEISINTLPHTNSTEIALAHKAVIVTGSEMPKFFAAKLKALGGDPKASQLVRFGGSRTIGGKLGEMLDAAGLTAYAGPPTGYVVTFSNGLSVYLSADTGITAEQESVVRGHYGVKLAVINIGDAFTTGSFEAAYVINQLVRPASVIASHANEAATRKSKPIPGTKTASFVDAVNVPAHLPLSGRTMAFSAAGICVSGC